MSNILLVDTNFSSNPIYQSLIQEGHKVVVVGGNSKDALAKCVDDYVNLDYTDLERMRQLITTRNIDYIVPGCNDRSYLVCAELNQDSRFPGIDSLDTTEIINNKKKFRAFAVNHRLSVPKVLTKEEIGTRWPVIVKPVDAYSGQGVTVIRESNKDKLLLAVSLAKESSKTKTCIIEDYVEGQLYSHTAFISHHQIIVDHIVEEHGTANPFVVDTSRVKYDFPAAILSRIREDIHVLSKELQLKDGLIHTQFISQGDQYWIIEITRRCPGDLYSQLIELSTGLNYAENYSRPFINEPFSLNLNSQTRWMMRHTITQPIEYIFSSLNFNQEINIKKFIPTSVTGDCLRGSPYGRVGVLFAEETSEKKLDILFKKTLERKLYTIT